MDAFAKPGFDNDNELMKIMSDVSPKNSENIKEDLFCEDHGIANLREGIRLLSIHWENKIKKLESQVDVTLNHEWFFRMSCLVLDVLLTPRTCWSQIVGPAPLLLHKKK
jgi:hypothetical protein